MIVVLFLLLGWLCFCILLLIWSLFVARSPYLHPLGRSLSRRWEQGEPGEESGVREPRRPRPPYWPPRAATAIPTDSRLQETSSLPGYSSSSRQPLRLEDGLA